MRPSRTAAARSFGPAPLLHTFLVACMLGAFALSAQVVTAFEPWWVQNHTETQLWSGPDSRAISFGRVPQWSHLLVVAPQDGPRLYVFNPRTQGYAYVDAAAVGPSSPPPTPSAATVATSAPTYLGRPGPSLPPGYEPWWVANFVETKMWSGPGGDAASIRDVPQFRSFMVVEPQQGNRLRVWSPEWDIFGYLDAAALGPSSPSVWMDAQLPRVTRQVGLPGRSVGNESYVRNLPIYDRETQLRRAPNNTRLDIREAVVAADGTEWYTVGDSQYILASEVRLPGPAGQSFPGRWIDADLRIPAMVTAYEGDRIVYSTLSIIGFTATATPKGTFRILRRVANETMDSSTIGIPRSAPGGYYLEDVLYTQYFTWDGASLHYNYWLGTFGYPGSHGCLGLNLEDAKWFWDWASVGTPVVIR